jgi:tRNA 2-thiouridine synthesizing protein A
VDDAAIRVDAEWDAGGMGCGERVLELRWLLDIMKPGQIMKLTARDHGAPIDIPAWCRMTGNPLVGGRPPIYLIRRKEDG